MERKPSSMRRIIRHLAVPAAVALAFFAVAAMPVEVLGCRGRGLLAVGIAIAGALAALADMVKAVIRRVRGDALSAWWVASALVLSIPALYVAVISR
jgi:hypothetical protein